MLPTIASARPRRRRRLVAVLALVGLSACGGDGNDGIAVPPPSLSTSGSTSVAGPSTTAERISVVLAAGRLTVGGNALLFGAPLSQGKSYLGKAFAETGKEADQTCGAGDLHSASWDGITTYYDATGFVGWFVDEGSLQTDKGIGLGATQQQVETAYPGVEVSESSLGTEFFVSGDPGLSGLLESGKVGALFSGANCFAR